MSRINEATDTETPSPLAGEGWGEGLVEKVDREEIKKRGGKHYLWMHELKK
jgi:hypothetical protein